MVEGKRFILFGLCLFLLTSYGTFAQSLPEWAIKILEEEASRGGADLEGLVSSYEGLFDKLLKNPLNINLANEEELSIFPLFTSFQVISILEYRQEYGEILSLSELSLVDGFSQEKAARIAPYITFGVTPDIHTKKSNIASSKLILRGAQKYESNAPFSYYGKYRLKVGETLQVGSTITNGGGSGYFQVKNIPLGERLEIKSGVVGDFSVRMGQGLLLWNSFSLSGIGAPSSVMRRGEGIYPFTSSSSETSLRGAGITLNYKINRGKNPPMRRQSVETTLFFSENASGKYTSNPIISAGWGCTYNGNRFRISSNGLFWRDSKASGGAYSADAMWSVGRFRFFGEGALDSKGNGAILLGSIAPISGDFEGGATFRWYSPNYESPYSGGYSSSSKCKNQVGVMGNILWTPWRWLKIKWWFDATYYPTPKYGVKVPSFEFETTLEGLIVIKRTHELSFRYKGRYYGHSDEIKTGIRLNYDYRPSAGIYGGIRGEVVWHSLSVGKDIPGMACYGELGYYPITRKWEVALRGTLYCIDNWKDRIYFYERELPSSFYIPALYKRGVSWYVYIKYAPLSRVGLYLKISNKIAKGEISLIF